MEKSRLQALCDLRRWARPEYAVQQEGPPHDPRFTATVTVKGSIFRSRGAARNSREAQSLAAVAALAHFESADAEVASQPPPPPPQSEKTISFKSQLQVYAQKRSKELPSYSHSSKGPDHAPKHKATVTLDGQTFKCPGDYPTVREAENAAAEAALKALPQEAGQAEVSQIDLCPYKNLLQEWAMKNCFSAPVYNTSMSGENIAIFTSTVSVAGKSFVGESARTKKQAEMKAAKVAYTDFQENKEHVLTSACSRSPLSQTFRTSAATTESSVASTFTCSSLNASTVMGNAVSAGENGKLKSVVQGNGAATVNAGTNGSFSLERFKSLSISADEEVSKVDNVSGDGPFSLESFKSLLISANAEERSVQRCSSASSSHHSNPEAAPHSKPPPCSKVVIVYQTRPDGLDLPEGACQLAISDDEWVAIGTTS